MSKGHMRISEEKARRIAVGATVGGVLLIIFLAVILIVQFVQIGVRKSRRAELDQQIEQYEQMIDSDRQDLEYYETQAGLFYLARKEGWR